MSVFVESSEAGCKASRPVALGLLGVLAVESLRSSQAPALVDVAAAVLSVLVLCFPSWLIPADSTKQRRAGIVRTLAACAAALCVTEMLRADALQPSALLLGAAILQLSHAEVVAGGTRSIRRTKSASGSLDAPIPVGDGGSSPVRTDRA